MESERKIELLELINSRGLNILVIIIGTIITLILGMKYASNMPESANMGVLLPLITATVYGFIVLISYLIFRKPLKNYSWLLTVLGITYMIYFSTNF